MRVQTILPVPSPSMLMTDCRQSLETVASLVRLYHPFKWTLETLSSRLTFVISEDEQIKAAVWTHPLARDGFSVPDVWEVHFVSAPEVRGRWLAPVVPYMLRTGIALGVRTLMAVISDPKIDRITARLGFKRIGPFAILRLK